ncbi:MAG: RecX family transcriptional regulator [Bacteroidales bacterium]|nr:RecX family transcriptional regulator [Bacteroidales bacterium]
MQRRQPLDYNKALERVAQWCAQSEHCSSEVQKKLVSYGLEDHEVAKGIAWLIDNRFIDDERFATFFVRDKHRFSGWGPQKIRFQLQLKHIKDDIISKAMLELEELPTNDTLQHLLESKLRSCHQSDPWKLKASLIRFAVSRGYSYDDILPIVEDLLSNRDYTDC